MVRARFVFAILAGLLAAAGTTTVIAPSQPARAEDPLFVDWSSLLPSLTDAYNPDSPNDCVAGRPACLDIIIREMRRRFAPLGRGCDHHAVFSLTYLRTTQTFAWAAGQPGYFADTPWVIHEGAVFAKYYFSARDNWASGNLTAVPRAWAIGLDAEKAHQVNGSGDLLLGINAHVNRDLPYALAAVAITYPDGATRKPDHDRVNQFLNAVVQPLMFELAARFDPDLINIQTPYGVGYTGLMQTLVAWREQAWRNAEALTDATSATARAAVMRQIEDTSAAEAQSLVTAYSYRPPATTSASRDAFCARNNAVAAPLAYAFGTPAPY